MLSNRCVQFLKGLEKNNTKEWFDAHRAEYESDVKNPFRELVQALIDRVTQVEPYYDCTPSQAIFRINRDVRFSANKAPYKTNIAAVIGPNGRKANPGFYMHMDAKNILIGGGAYEITKEQLDTIRSFIVKNPNALPKAVQEKNFAKVYGEILGEKNKILPPLYKQAAEKNPYLFYKQFYFMHEMPTKDFISSKRQVDILFAHFVAALSVNNALRQAMQL